MLSPVQGCFKGNAKFRFYAGYAVLDVLLRRAWQDNRRHCEVFGRFSAVPPVPNFVNKGEQGFAFYACVHWYLY